jgi:hypothetical protein
VTTPKKAMKCIKVKALFELVALIQKDIDAEQGAPDSMCMPTLPSFKCFLILFSGVSIWHDWYLKTDVFT